MHTHTHTRSHALYSVGTPKQPAGGAGSIRALKPRVCKLTRTARARMWARSPFDFKSLRVGTFNPSLFGSQMKNSSRASSPPLFGDQRATFVRSARRP